MVLCDVSVKAPARPAAPQVVEPLTDPTVPETRWGRGGITVTAVAVTTSLVEIVPVARALSPTQTSAKEGALTPCSLKVVVVAPTSTVKGVLGEVTAKTPAVPAVPHAPDVVEPLTDPTVPETRWGRGGITVTAVAVTTSLVEIVPVARALSPTQTSAKEGALTPCSLKVVVVAPTSTVKGVLGEVTAKTPAVPAVPHAPDVVEPLTDPTVPETRWGRGGITVTAVAVTTSLVEIVPVARALSPTQTSAKEGALTPCSLKVVVVAPTSTVKGVLGEVTVKTPAVPAVPHAPDVVEPLTDPTVPETRWGRGGITVTAVAVTTSLVEIVPVARALSPTQTSAKEGALTPCSLKVVVVAPTSTVKGVLGEVTVKTPAVPAVPHAPDVVEPLTEPTVPETVR